jgi:hypothetical protein
MASAQFGRMQVDHELAQYRDYPYLYREIFRTAMTEILRAQPVLTGLCGFSCYGCISNRPLRSRNRRTRRNEIYNRNLRR